ncbi:hypothetical protein [Vibrio crassostreae]|uniref:hypothetical protein n=1 Tax=Vibrio crassostreae TaxID=246167 RepID=UPI001B30EE6F|nr:hypothetical protein [Vibrio crassostreae]
MGSRATVHLPQGVKRGGWDLFCENNNIQFSPTTIGKNTYYFDSVMVHNHVVGQVQCEVKPNGDGLITSVRIGSFFMSNLKESATVISTVCNYFADESPVRVTGDEEVLKHIIETESILIDQQE